MKNMMVSFIVLFFSSFAMAEPNSPFEGVYQRYVNEKIDTDGSKITITKLKNNKYKVTGNSIWIGNIETGNINTGELDGTALAEGNVIHYSKGYELEWICKLTITFSNDYMSVTNDNNKCGGLNVTFNGFYKKI